MHPNLLAALVEDRRKACLCGAVSEQPHHPCRKCLVRLVWRRHARRPLRNAVRRSAARPTCMRAWAFAAATRTLRVISKAARS